MAGRRASRSSAPPKGRKRARKKKQSPEANGTSPVSKVPRGPRLTAARQALRDTLMLTRKAQGWTNGAIAAEAGISVTAAKDAMRNRRETLPDLLDQDPMEIIQNLLEQISASAGDLELMAVAYSEAHPSAAVGAKKAAHEARRDLASLLQATGKLPKELGTLRHLVDVRAVAVQIITGLDEFLEAVRAAKLPPAKRKPILEAADRLERTLETMTGSAETRKG